MIHTVKGFSVVNEAEIDAFLEFSYFFYDPVDVDNLASISASLVQSFNLRWKSSRDIWWLLLPNNVNIPNTTELYA